MRSSALGVALLVSGSCSDAVGVDPAIFWSARDSGFGGAAVMGAAHGGGQFVIVGEGGRIARSADGTAWMQTTSTFGTRNVHDVLYADGWFVAVGEDTTGEQRTLSISRDAVEWAPVVTASPHALRAVAHGGDVWVVVGDQGTIQRSVNLTDWELVAPSRRAKWISAIYSRGRFVVVGGEEAIMISTDGSGGSWQQIDLGRQVPPECDLSLTCNDIDDIVDAGAWYVAVTHPAGEVFRSRDLRSWERRLGGGGSEGSGLWFAGRAEGLVFVGGKGGRLLVSGDEGTTWTEEAVPVGGSGLIAFAAGGGHVLLGGLNGTLVTGRWQ